ncbi:MAG: hypothetical protein ACD_78C00067G0003, partial [uncultured bacterium (gcode 4)]
TTNAEIDLQSTTTAGSHWGIYQNSADQSLRFWNASSNDAITVLPSGRVGIGTVSPLRALHIKSAVGTAQIESTGNASTLYFGDTTSSVIDNQGIGSAGNDMTIFAGGLEKFRVTSAGNVGIGTSSPLRKLHVSSDWMIVDNTYGLLGLNTTGGQKIIAQIRNDNNYGFGESALVITSGGNVGIGTTAPGYKLDVNSNSIRFGDGGSATLIMNVPASDTVAGYINVGGSNRISILGSSGNVGIGVTAPTNPLVVDSNNGATSSIVAYSTQANDAFSILPHAGQTYLASWIYYKNGAWVHDGYNTKNALFAFGWAGASWYASNDSSASWNVASAIPLWSAAGVLQGVSSKTSKENYESLDFRDILDKIDELSVEKWNYKTEGKDIKHIGPYAEDFRASFGLGESDKSIALIDEAGVALAGVKGLLRIVREQEQTIQELRKDVENLKQVR